MQEALHFVVIFGPEIIQICGYLVEVNCLICYDSAVDISEIFHSLGHFFKSYFSTYGCLLSDDGMYYFFFHDSLLNHSMQFTNYCFKLKIMYSLLKKSIQDLFDY